LDRLFLIAGSGHYPGLVIRAARKAGVPHISIAAFEGETREDVVALADEVAWMRVGQLGKLLDAAKKSGAAGAIMAGQIAPKNLFDLRPDVKALLLLATIKERNAETLFGAIADALGKIDVPLLPATTYLEDQLTTEGLMAGPKLKDREVEDTVFGMRIAKETSRLDIGQTVVVKNGTVLAVEAFEGTDEAISRGGRVGRGGGFVVKVSKPNQDLRFDVPVVGEQTVESAAKAGLRGIVAEAGKVLLLNREKVCASAERNKISLFGVKA
jgi:UDP-2,3-diacylglucosamine hydrolase